MTGGTDMEVHGVLMDVKRYAVHDGPGIRTTLFLKGCPLRCIWCHNPEGMISSPQVAYYEQKCINCGECVRICSYGAHSLLTGVHTFDREKCQCCGSCVDYCLGMALKFYGKTITVKEALNICAEDLPFYESSGGGVTVSGGEPLMQADFCRELFIELKKMNISTAVDTCGYVEWKAFEKVLELTDIFLFDVKHIDSDKHELLTGKGNNLIFENLVRLSKTKAKIEIRIPLIPGCNDEKEVIDRIGNLLSQLRIDKVRVLPYNRFAGSKYFALGMPFDVSNVLSSSVSSIETVKQAVDLLKTYGINVIPVEFYTGREYVNKESILVTNSNDSR